MNQLLTVWENLTATRRIVVVAAAVAMFAAVLGVAQLSTRGDMALLYSGLDPSASGEVISALEQQGISYSVRGGAIYVDAAQRDALRMTLASQGLPAASSQGYEILDSLSGFATTSQMFDAAYWRAKEGELARTILSNPAIRAARVHISTEAGNAFRRDPKSSASVSITTISGALSKEQARSLRYLVSSAVAGMKPESVSVIDARNGTVIGDQDPNGMTDASDRAAALKTSVERLLEARVGPGRAVVEVSVDVVKDTESLVERTIDPNTRTVISTDTEERAGSSSDSGPGGVTVASNLPTGDAAGGAAKSQNSETRERVNYEVSQTTREVLRAPGGIGRITVAVLVDGLRSTDAQGAPIWEPRSEDELESLRELVAGAVGFNADRNDVISVKSMEFEPLDLTAGTLVAADDLSTPLNLTALGQIGILGVVAMVLGLFVLRPILTNRRQIEDLPPPLELAAAATTPALTGEVDPPEAPGLDALESTRGPARLSDKNDLTSDPVARLRRLIEERREETVEILRGWVEENEEQA